MTELTNVNVLLGLFMNPHGRLSRQNFFVGLIVLTALVGVSLFILSFAGLFLRALEFPILTDLVFFTPMFFGAYGFITMSAKRLHDMNLSGWWGMPGLIPIFGTLPMFIILFLIKGSEGDNRYGADPTRFA
tara:strand:+ start:99 stop:491 length:393 start_codon:yes stop_codon:yes gene_type:complete